MFVFSMLKVHAVARRSMRSHRVQWKCHCVAAVMLECVLRAPRRSAFLGRCGIAVRTPTWCDKGLGFYNGKCDNALDSLEIIASCDLEFG